MVVTLGQQYNVGEKPTVILLYKYIDHHAAIPNKQRQNTIILTYSSLCYNLSVGT